MKKKSNIILIGMAGAGKSTTGVVVAKILAKDFIDGDLVIQHVTGKPLQTIINEEGNDGFRKVEEEVLCGINVENTVIAPGGSAIYYPSVQPGYPRCDPGTGTDGCRPLLPASAAVSEICRYHN